MSESDENRHRLLGARDGLISALLMVRNEITRIDGRYAPTINPRHIRKRAARDAVLKPLRDIERRIEKECSDVREAYSAIATHPENG